MNSTKATKDEDPTQPSQFEQMTAEDREFLDKALKSLTINVVEELNRAMKTLMEGNSSEDDQVQALEVVTSYVEDMDTANGKTPPLSPHSLHADLVKYF